MSRVRRSKKNTELPPLKLARYLGSDSTGTRWAEDAELLDRAANAEKFVLTGPKKSTLDEGSLFLGKLAPNSPDLTAAEISIFRKLTPNEDIHMGMFQGDTHGGRILPISKGRSPTIRVSPENTNSAQNGDIVEAVSIAPLDRKNTVFARVTNIISNEKNASLSTIAIKQHGINNTFSAEVLADAVLSAKKPLNNHVDLLNIPFVTIDPSDAKDHDDAVYAELDTNSANSGGFIIWVAIADVAHYVKPGSPLDLEAVERGNSCYFPDQVVPMLPEQLSGDVCSLHEDAQRPCIVAKIVITKDGNKLSQEFMRGIICSRASLTYEEVQSAYDGTATSAKVAPLMNNVVSPLFDAYAALKRARLIRQPLELDLPERKIVLDDQHAISEVCLVERLDTHQLIEELMVLANVAAAEELISRKCAPIFRIHEEPSAEKMEVLRQSIRASGLKFPKTKAVTPAVLNSLMKQATDTNSSELVSISVLRSMNQALYHPVNLGHFGLALKSYTHFTSPIRRYADLIVHRALITSHGFGDDGLSDADISKLADTALQISTAERRAMVAERETNDRYIAQHLSERAGEEFAGQISGVTNFAVFVRLDENGADGLIPVKSIGREYYHFQQDTQTLIGEKSGRVIRAGLSVQVKLVEAHASNGAIALELLSIDGSTLTKPKKHKNSRYKKREHRR